MATTMNPIIITIPHDNEEPDELQFASTEGWIGLAAYIPWDDVGHPAVNESFRAGPASICWSIPSPREGTRASTSDRPAMSQTGCLST